MGLCLPIWFVFGVQSNATVTAVMLCGGWRELGRRCVCDLAISFQLQSAPDSQQSCPLGDWGDFEFDHTSPKPDTNGFGPACQRDTECY